MPSRPIPDIRIAVVLASLLLSCWAIYSAALINNDGVVYLAAAGRILHGDWEGAYQLYNWPVYSVLIAAIGKISGLGLETSAQLLDTLFSATLALTFVTLIRDFGGDRKTLWIAAFVILFHPYINDAREEIIRDHGYWTLYLASILYFFRFYRKPCWRYAFAWSAIMAAATLFRIEGLALLFLLPLALLTAPDKNTRRRVALLLQASTFAFILAGLLAIFYFLQPDSYANWAGRLDEPGYRISLLWGEFADDLRQKADVVRTRILTPWSDDYAIPVIYFTLILMLVDKTVRTLTPLYSILPFFSKLRTRFNPPPGTIRVLVWLVVLNVSVVMVFLINEFFISSRYIVPLVLALLTMTPFVLASLHDQWVARRSLAPVWKVIFPIAVVLLIFMAGDGMITLKGSNRTYLREAGEWIQENVPAEAGLFTNNQLVRYYSGRSITDLDQTMNKSNFSWLDTDEWKHSLYLAIMINRYTEPQHAQRVANIDAELLQTFRNRRNERVVILKLSRQTADGEGRL